MSRQAIAAVLARTDLASGERLVALSLASFAGRENRAWPGAPAASARAGLSRSRYQQAREQLVARGLVAVDERVTGRGRASTVTLLFADAGPWWDGDINVELFEAVLTYSRARGPERLLLATMAALADERGEVCDLSTEQLCAAAGIADRTYRRARTALLESGRARAGQRRWRPREHKCMDRARPARGGRRGRQPAPRRVAPPAARGRWSPRQFTSLARFTSRRADGGKGGQDRTLSAGNSPILTGVSGPKGGHDRTVSPEKCPVLTGVSGAKGGQDQTLFELAPLETPAQTPAKTAETPAANARAGREPLNPRTRKHPPSPPEGGSPPDSIFVEETYVTLAVASADERSGSTSTRSVETSGSQALPIATTGSRSESCLRELVGDSTFEIWLEPLELIAVDPTGRSSSPHRQPRADGSRQRFARRARSMRRAALARTALRG